MAAQDADFYYDVSPSIQFSTMFLTIVSDNDIERAKAAYDTSYCWYYSRPNIRIACKADIKTIAWLAFGT